MRRKLVIATTILAAAAFAGGAYAATQSSSTNTRQNYLNDVAKRLHVSPAQLTAALKGASDDQLNAAVKAGRLTQAQANAIKQKMQSRGGVPAPFPFRFEAPRPGPGPGGGQGGHGRHGILGGHGVPAAVATYLGLTRAQLAKQLRSGKSLAQVAQAQGKTTSGLKQAITTAVKARLAKAVANKRITSGEEQQLLSRVSARLDALINRTPPPLAGRRWRGPPGFGPGSGGPPPHPGSFVPPGP